MVGVVAWSRDALTTGRCAAAADSRDEELCPQRLPRRGHSVPPNRRDRESAAGGAADIASLCVARTRRFAAPPLDVLPQANAPR